MTINKLPNQDDVRLNSGFCGYQYNCIRTLPDELAIATTGGGSVNADAGGARADAGNTSGDNAGLRGFYAPYTANGMQEFRFTLVVVTQNPTDYSGYARVGITNADTTLQQGAYIDLKNALAVVEGNTTDITLNSTRRSAMVDIRVDFSSGTTEFELSGDASGEASFNSTPSIDSANNVSYHVFVEAGDNSSGRDMIDLIWGRETWYL